MDDAPSPRRSVLWNIKIGSFWMYRVLHYPQIFSCSVARSQRIDATLGILQLIVDVTAVLS